MAGQAGYNAALKIGSATVGYAQDVDLDISRDPIKKTSRGDAPYNTYLPGLIDWGVDIKALFVPDNESLSSLVDALLNGSEVTVELQDADGETGDKYSGSALVTNIKRSEALEDAISLPVTLKGTGALTHTAPSS